MDVSRPTKYNPRRFYDAIVSQFPRGLSQETIEKIGINNSPDCCFSARSRDYL